MRHPARSRSSGNLPIVVGWSVVDEQQSDAGTRDAHQPVIEVQVIDGWLPRYAISGDAGADLCLAEDVHLGPGQRVLARTGIAIALPPGYAGFVHPRSGLAARHGVTLVNAPGTIDSGYRGEIMVNLINLDPVLPVSLRRGDRVAQLVIQEVATATFSECAVLPESDRGVGGHGSTGGYRSAAARASNVTNANALPTPGS